MVAKLQTALTEFAKDPPDTDAAAGNIEGAIGDIQVMIDDGLLDHTLGQSLIVTLNQIAQG